VQDALLHQGAQTVEGGSAVDMVKAALLARDEALQKVRTALAEAQTAAAEREMALAMVQAQLQQDCATLEGARSWQNQAKKAERLGADLADKVTRLMRWGAAPPGAECTPVGGESAPAGAVCPQGGPGCP
jgi:hypothetical protein